MRQQQLLTSIIAFIILATIVIGCGLPEQVPINRVVSESFIADIDFSSWIAESVTISDDYKRVAYAIQEGSHEVSVVVDGEKGKQYNGVGHPIFSPNSQRVAYIATLGKKAFAVVDGIEGKRYDGAGSLVFSPDSQRVAYPAQVGDKWLVVVDGIEGKQYDIVLLLTFSPDSQHVFYTSGVFNKFMFWDIRHAFVVVDGIEVKKHGGYLGTRFSPGFKRVVSITGVHYDEPWGWEADWVAVVEDGKRGKKYDKILSPIKKNSTTHRRISFSPDSQHMAYTAIEDNKIFVVVDGKEGKKYDFVGGYSRPARKSLLLDINMATHTFGYYCRSPVTFGTADTFHYPVLKHEGFYLVEERIE